MQRIAGARFDVKTVDVEYLSVGGRAFLATIYLPECSGPRPGMLDVHGGAWTSSTRFTDKVEAMGLAEQGIVVMSVDFRVAPVDPYPAQVQDVHYAIRWFKSHAAEYDVSAESIGAFGSSSGGNTAMLCALRPDDASYAALPLEDASVDARLRYVIPCWPILDPLARYAFAQETGREDLVTRTNGYFPNPEDMKVGNPQLILERGEFQDLPPVLLIQGTADTNLSMEMSERFVATYQEKGGSARLEQFPGMPHGFMAEPRPETDRGIELMLDFIWTQVASVTA